VWWGAALQAARRPTNVDINAARSRAVYVSGGIADSVSDWRPRPRVKLFEINELRSARVWSVGCSSWRRRTTRRKARTVMITATKFKVFGLSERKDKGETRSTFTRVGIAFVNRDNSINLYLDAIPIGGKLQLRDFDEPDRRAPVEGATADGASTTSTLADAALASAALGSAHATSRLDPIPF
jgi:hypothetical protein